MTRSLEGLRQSLPDYARDIKLNLGALLGEAGLPELTAGQKWGAAVAAAIAGRNAVLTRAIEHEAMLHTDERHVEAAQTASAIMAMTNVYYRAVHMAADPELSRLPAGLRMNGLTKHGVAQADFELFGLAASVVKGCEGCTKAHIDGARKHQCSVPAIQGVIRLAAVIHAAATVLDEETDPALFEPLPGSALLNETPQPGKGWADDRAALIGGVDKGRSPAVRP
ncbi:carboxymuconolactone decarboxylase family protein [Bosea sp. (in: a-proteobacteria)]